MGGTGSDTYCAISRVRRRQGDRVRLVLYVREYVQGGQKQVYSCEYTKQFILVSVLIIVLFISTTAFAIYNT